MNKEQTTKKVKGIYFVGNPFNIEGSTRRKSALPQHKPEEHKPEEHKHEEHKHEEHKHEEHKSEPQTKATVTETKPEHKKLKIKPKRKRQKHKLMDIKAVGRGIAKPGLRRLARRGGIKRLSHTLYDEIIGILKYFTIMLLAHTLPIVTHAGRKVVQAKDVVAGVKLDGKVMLGFGAFNDFKH